VNTHLVNQQNPSAAAHNQKWPSDISYVWTDEGVAVSRRGFGPALTSHRGMVDEPRDDATTDV